MDIVIRNIIDKYKSDKTRLMDMLWGVHNKYNYLPKEAIKILSLGLNMSVIDIEETASFYHFFHLKPAGKYRIYLADTVIAKMNGFYEVLKSLEQETSCLLGSVDETETFGLFAEGVEDWSYMKFPFLKKTWKRRRFCKSWTFR